jgi:outer membrane protein assembly factor BamA
VGLEGRMTNGTLTASDEAEKENLNDQISVSPSIAYVHDTTLYTAIGPLDGRRSRLAVYQAFGDLIHATFVADYRWYWHLTRRSALAFRTTAYASLGENARMFEIGGPNSFRGRQSDAEAKLWGSKVALCGTEYRFPLLPKVNFLRGTVFVDTALVWNDTVQPFTTHETGGPQLNDLHAAYGVGLRVPLRGPFGLVNARVDIAQETNLRENLGKRSIIFSLGNDF